MLFDDRITALKRSSIFPIDVRRIVDAERNDYVNDRLYQMPSLTGEQ